MECLYTIIEFIFIANSREFEVKEMKCQLELQGGEFSLNDKSQIHFKAKCPSRKIYYRETITLLYKDKGLCTFQFLIYIGKTNKIIFDLDEINRPSFELFFYFKESQYNPTHIIYKNVEYDQLENYGNKFRSRIFFANVNPAELEYINSPALNEYKAKFENNTYQSIFRLISENQFEVSLTDMACYITDIEEMKVKKLNENEFARLKNLLSDFSGKYFKFIYTDNTSRNNKQKIYEDLKVLSERITSCEHYHFINSPNMNDYQNYSAGELLYLFNQDFLLSEFIKLKEEYKSPNSDGFKSIITKIKAHHNIVDNLYQKLFNDNNLNINQKIKILKTVTIFFKNSLLLEKKILGVNYVNMNSIDNKSPYFKSVELLREIISEIDEESRLFEAFLYFDSEIIENILVENSQKNYTYKDIFGQKVEVFQPKFITEYGMTLMTLDEIKKHLLELLPQVIIQIDTNINIRALYENKTKMMVINELKMFYNGFHVNENNLFKLDPDSYTIPISMEILHEALGHGKLRYCEDLENYKLSPMIVRDSKNFFKPKKLIKRIKLFDNTEKDINQGETGRVIEYYISANPEVIQTLKEKTFNKKILNVSYWTGKNFDKLHEAIGANNQSNYSLNNDYIMADEYHFNEGNYDCMFNKFNIHAKHHNK